ncbi:POLYAMINE-MODULATED FACTOR 1 [Salix purpurea]|uniref:POLYAMINE-MODULATED FACTOR 1 n=1 Tax=Salix purpurea TaxID=77065 RepID=A0A9Q0YV90_SALPP|nr:POLYAMINE-MODULATED FACTOR 1 [Salix purpurea]
MEKATSSAAPAKIGGGGGGSRRQSDLNRSFKLAIRSLLTSCSKQELAKAFSNFSNAEQESLHRLFIQVITSLHKMVEDEFESLCLETQVGTALETVEQLVEEKNLDPLFSEKSNIMDAVQNLSMAKRNEIHYLMGMLEKAEEQNRCLQDRVELLRQKMPDDSGISVVMEKFKSGILSYGTCSDGI